MSKLTLFAPSSKSVTQRALFIAALARGSSFIERPLDCDDSRLLRAALKEMGVEIYEEESAWRVVGGVKRLPNKPIYCGNAGTALRFLASLSLAVEGSLTLEGSARMSERPIGALAKALASLGAEVFFLGKNGFPPIKSEGVNCSGGAVEIEASESSQFASSLMMIAPLLEKGLRITLIGDTNSPTPPASMPKSSAQNLVSLPYLQLTAQMMRGFGCDVELNNGLITIPPGEYRGRSFEVEGDWSAAAFLLAAAEISGKSVEIPNVSAASAQGDKAIVEILQKLRTQKESRIDIAETPDLIAPVVAAAAFAKGKTILTGAAHTRVKESDRIAVLCEGFKKLGASMLELPDGIEIRPSKLCGGVALDPRNDHRMAMAFGLASLRLEGIRIIDKECVSKSFPDFWRVLEKFR